MTCESKHSLCTAEIGPQGHVITASAPATKSHLLARARCLRVGFGLEATVLGVKRRSGGVGKRR